MQLGGANTVVLPMDKSHKINDNVSLPMFGEVSLHLPDFFVLKTKKGYKLVPPVTKTGAMTSRNKKRSFNIVKNEKNELFLHEPSFPQIHLKEFSKKDRQIIEKYFHKIPVHRRARSHSSKSKSKSKSKSHSSRSSSKSSKSKHSFIAPSFIERKTGSSVSTISSDGTMDLGTDVILPSGKKKYNVYKQPEEEKADEKREKTEMAANDTRRIARLARIASKKQGKGKGKVKTSRRY